MSDAGVKVKRSGIDAEGQRWLVECSSGDGLIDDGWGMFDTREMALEYGLVWCNAYFERLAPKDEP